jgi:hypothetical protein
MRQHRSLLLVIFIALWMPIVCLFASLYGCASGTSGTFRPLDPTVEHDITNAITSYVQPAAQALPPPMSTAVQATAAAVLALLAAWQGLTHKAVTKLADKASQPPEAPKI